MGKGVEDAERSQAGWKWNRENTLGPGGRPGDSRFSYIAKKLSLKAIPRKNSKNAAVQHLSEGRTTWGGCWERQYHLNIHIRCSGTQDKWLLFREATHFAPLSLGSCCSCYLVMLFFLYLIFKIQLGTFVTFLSQADSFLWALTGFNIEITACMLPYLEFLLSMSAFPICWRVPWECLSISHPPPCPL